MNRFSFATLSILFLAVVLAGCKPNETGETTPQTNPGSDKEGEHGHKPGGTVKEKQMFLTPGGKYTQTDIEANKGQVPSQKFKDFVADHDDTPKPGDWVCPVTATKASPECSWVVDGQTYHFCCPPCVTDWVKNAKNNPEKLRPAAEYLKPLEDKK